MIYNATLVRVDPRQPATAGGRLVFSTGPSIAVRCAIDAAKTSQGWTAEQLREASDGVLYVLLEDMPAGVAVGNGDRVAVLLDGEGAARAYQTHALTTNVKLNLSHVRCLLRSE